MFLGSSKETPKGQFTLLQRKQPQQTPPWVLSVSVFWVLECLRCDVL